MSEKTSKARKALTIALVSAGGLSALLGNVQFKSDEGVIFGKGVSIGLNQADASTCDRDKNGKVTCGCSQGCGIQ
jgi:hypothetical protein